ncbi:MAG TPA: YbjN domain-containing protein [Nocardioides sp.]|nr:YbjN domain-containing protein [Nocardioides sp.]
MALLDVVRRVLDDDEWNYEIVGDGALLRMRFTGEHGSWRVFVGVDDDDGVVSVDSVLDQFAPDNRRSEVVELLTRANWNKRIGGFQFDYSDGEIRYHSAIDVEGGDLTQKMFTNLLFSNLATTDRYYGAVMAVCYAKVDALSALLAMEDED